VGIYILLLGVAEKTLIKCAKLKILLPSGLQLASEDTPTRIIARDSSVMAKRPASVDTHNIATRINLVIAMRYKNMNRLDSRFRIS
jgi:hypothetical protein